MRDESRMFHAGRVRDNEGEGVELWLPNADYVDDMAGDLLAGIFPFPDAVLPTSATDLWDTDNLATVTTMLSGRVLNPYARGRAFYPHFAKQIHDISPKALRWLLHGYLAGVMVDGLLMSWEQMGCNGSTIVPDLWEFGWRMKDPGSVAHDLEWAMHFAGDLRDAFGNVPDFSRSNRRYRDVLRGLGHERVAAERFQGLELLGRGRWNAAD